MPPPLKQDSNQHAPSGGSSKFPFVGGILVAALGLILLVLGLISLINHTHLHEITYVTLPAAGVLFIFAIITLIISIICTSKGGGKKASTGIWCSAVGIVLTAATVCVGIATVIKHEAYVNALYDYNYYYEDILEDEPADVYLDEPYDDDYGYEYDNYDYN